MADSEIIRTFSPTEQKLWDDWLQREIKKMVLDPDSAINHVITLRLEVMMQQIEKDTPTLVTKKIDALRTELTEQQDKRETTWLKKLMTW